MRYIILLLLLTGQLLANGQEFFFNGWKYATPPEIPDTVKINFGRYYRDVPGWTAFNGDYAATNVYSLTVSGVTITTTAATLTNWTGESGATAANNAAPSSTYEGWPGDVGLDYFFNKKSAAPTSTANEHFTVSGLTPFATYGFQWLGSRTTGDASRTCYYTIRDNIGVATSALHEAKGGHEDNEIVTLTGVANASGVIYLSGYGGGTTANSLYVYYNALKIYKIIL